MYPGRTSGSIFCNLNFGSYQADGKGIHVFGCKNNQSTVAAGSSALNVTISDGVAATITVMMAVDLTGKPNHETSLKRPPRMQTNYAYDGSNLTAKGSIWRPYLHSTESKREVWCSLRLTSLAP
ncbi:hypothetical protein OH492_16770 [Vibrio chagasii]|nr:hypothetical protein [Vibrio chagasii]